MVKRPKRSYKLDPQILLWIAIVVPFIYNPARGIESVLIGPLEIIKGGLPILLGFIFALFKKDQSIGKLNERKSLNSFLPLPLSLFITLQFVSVMWSVNPLATFLKATQYFGVILCILLLVRIRINYSNHLLGLLTFLHLIAVTGVLENFFFRAEPGRFSILVPSVSSNLVPLVYFLPLLSLIFNIGRGIFNNSFTRFPLIVIYLYAIIESKSRIATVTSLSILICLVAFKALSKNADLKSFNVAYIMFLLIGIPCVVIAYLTSQRLQSNLNDFLVRGQDSRGLQTLTGRTSVWNYAFEYLSQNWLTGGGYYSGHRYALGTRYTLISQHSNLDNTWIELAVDLGVLGPTLGLAIIILALKRFKNLSGYERSLSLSYCLLFLAISFFNPTFQTVQITQVVFFYLLIYAQFRHHEKRAAFHGKVARSLEYGIKD